MIGTPPTVHTNYHWRETSYAVPDWGVEEEECFEYKGEVYFFCEFLRTAGIPHCPEWLAPWDGYASDSFFSGVVVRYAQPQDWDHEGLVQVGTYIG